MPDEIATPHPRFGRDRWPERLGGRAVRSVDAYGKHLFVRFEGDLVDPLAPAHDRLLEGAAGRPGAGVRLARDAPRRAGRGPAPRPGAGADDRVAHALRPAAGRARARHPGRPSSTRPSSCAGCATRTRRGRSATRCSTSGRSPASATCGRARAASPPASTRGGPSARSATTRRWRSCASCARACSSRPPTAARTAGAGSTTGRDGRARAAATPIRARGMGDDNRPTFWCPSCQH